MFYSTITNNDYELYFASEDWLDGAWYDTWHLPAGNSWRLVDEMYYNRTTQRNATPIYDSDPAAFVSAYQQDSLSFQRLGPEACIDAYANTYLSNRRNVALISPFVLNSTDFPSAYKEEILAVKSNSSLHWVTLSSDGSLYNKADRYGWLCDIWGTREPACTNADAKAYAATGNWTIYGWPVSACISQLLEEKCSVNYHLGIAITVILANLGKSICIALVCLWLADQPFLTIGDAIVSFLRAPDQSTIGCCLLDRRDVQSQWKDSHRAERQLPPKAYLSQVSHRWSAPGWKSWTSFVVL